MQKVVISWYYYESDRYNKVFWSKFKETRPKWQLEPRGRCQENERRSLNTSRASDILDEIFVESLKSPDCVNILFSCIKNVEKQITQIFESTNEIKEGQIKGEKQLAELTEAIDFSSNKFDEYEKDRKEKEERIKTLEDCLINMSKRVDSLSGQVDK